MKPTDRLSTSIAILIALFVGLSSATNAQQPAASATDSLSGTYEGTAKVAGSPDVQVKLELKNQDGKITGNFNNGSSMVQIAEGSIFDGKLSLKFAASPKEGTLTGRVEGAKITGEWISGSEKRSVELHRLAADVTNLAGDWDAVADAQGQPFPFALALKLEGDKVTGSSNSQLGESTITAGTWKDGHLNFQLESPNGNVIMTAVLVDGKLSGEFDFAGQMQGKWVAVKKK
ncbi:MAG: hypothetical protein ABR555_16550 [Pyrinomonadaceae bacterium]